MGSHSNNDHDLYHITPFSTYLKVYGILIVMTVLTVFTATQVHLGWLNTPLAMAIASFKAWLVVWWFMHQKYENKINRLIFVSGFIFLAIFIFFCAADIWTRVNFSEIKFAK